MARKSIRVEIYYRQPDKTTKLLDEIKEKHDDLAATSPLNGFFDMAAIDAQNTQVKQLRHDAKVALALAQSEYNKCEVTCGYGDGQNKQSGDTVFVMVTQIRDVLLLKYRDTPESLSDFGFEVVISVKQGRRYVRVDLPKDNPSDLITLAEDITEKHEELVALPAGSPLTGQVDMADFKTKHIAAAALYASFETQDGIHQNKFQEADSILGYAEGQNEQTIGTLYYSITGIRDRLLLKYKGTEEALSEWGFDVVLGSYLSGRKKNQPVPPDA